MEINNTEYGSFIVSKNVMHGKAIGYTYVRKVKFLNSMGGQYIVWQMIISL